MPSSDAASVSLPDAAVPFVLIDDARAEGAGSSRLYHNPVEIIEACTLAEVVPALDRLREAQQCGLHCAGFLSYEAGYALEPRLIEPPLQPTLFAQDDDPPLLWFGIFAGYDSIASEDVPALFPSADTPIGKLRPAITQKVYADAFAQVQTLIRAGDIYQANLTFPCSVDMRGDLRALYGAIRPRAAAGHGALVMTGKHGLLSFSPELFFVLDKGTITTRPMKGTAIRHEDVAVDRDVARHLQSDPKQRAENLMIVDLLRNDISRVAEPGSVSVPHLFAIESYPTVHQMTSTVTGQLRAGLDAVDVITALFPCGSITGAPKVRAMEVIRSVEARKRGPYTGSIGSIDPDGSASFNVAIRTICVKDGDEVGELGLGSGVVADSHIQGEWNECLDKARFLFGDRMDVHCDSDD